MSFSTNSRTERMFRTPVSSCALAAKWGYRSSAARSPVWNTSCSLMASRQGPSSTSLWIESTRPGKVVARGRGGDLPPLDQRDAGEVTAVEMLHGEVHDLGQRCLLVFVGGQ